MRTPFRLALACAATFLLALCSGCANDVASRGTIVTSDGVVLAQSAHPERTQSAREYPEGQLAGHVVGSCYAGEAAEGLEATYAEQLESGLSLTLTLNADVQRAAESALEGASGAIVVMDPHSGAVLALASTPATDPSQPDSENTADNKALAARIPGSVFKTITLCAALESGMVTMDSIMSAPAFITLEGGSVSNMNAVQYGKLTVQKAYEQSVNTVFAQMSMGLGAERINALAEEFGFGQNLARDLACDASSIEGLGSMSPLAEAWCGVGQALIQPDGTLEGPVTTPLHMAAITSCFVNGGILYQPYLVQATDAADGTREVASPTVLNEGFLSDTTLAAVESAMRGVVVSGTGTSAFVDNMYVGGKTGTAETSRGVDDGWFCGYALTDSGDYAVVVMLEDATSAQAASLAAGVMQGIVSQ